MNTFGTIFRLTSFGESHGRGIGGVIDGMPAGIKIEYDFIQNELNRRRPGQSSIVTPRKENDKVEFLSGVYEGYSTGAPIGFVIYNENQHSSDYNNLKETFRPSHADYTYTQKYGIRDHRGGGRSSARETIARCVAGALAKLVLKELSIDIKAFTSQVGNISLSKDYRQYDLSRIEENIVRCPDEKKAAKMIALIDEVRAAGDTIGGVITCVIQNMPVGLGDPVFNKLHAELGGAMLGINAVKGFEYGMGFDGVQYRGSQMNDVFVQKDGRVSTLTNNSGGIQGGISNGEDIYFRVAFKPVATILRDIQTLDKSGAEVILKAKGRHDPCVLPRAVPIVEAMAAIVILDHYLLNKTKHI
ncbi:MULTISPECIES: chorismate synthase [Bacteroidales]|jgi:chorismate synthase|uniref:Chorismate synthase n=1 Tax=Coprobacter secundus subsp. similis TaxID=2751153 RepID=A0A7G1HUS6_9BACT|nr:MULTISPECIES: chorismate synthase [Bacteroidales]KHM48675.1 chorismate synthase [Coprobacter secundus]BCI63426.1 chorismate synthase [Coprobacter secundus subsp. similis]CCY36462.1 chorismate synthase [Tannerella sp. CAG:118]